MHPVPGRRLTVPILIGVATLVFSRIHLIPILRALNPPAGTVACEAA